MACASAGVPCSPVEVGGMACVACRSGEAWVLAAPGAGVSAACVRSAAAAEVGGIGVPAPAATPQATCTNIKIKAAAISGLDTSKGFIVVLLLVLLFPRSQTCFRFTCNMAIFVEWLNG